MATHLWDYFDGEPFLTNPRLGIIGLNSRGKKGKKMAARKRRSTRRRTSASVNPRRRTRRKSYRRNAYPVAGLVVNPRRRRASRRRVANPRRRRSSMRRNPAIFGIGLPPINSVIFAGIGFIAPPMVEGFLNRTLPSSITSSTLGKYAIRVASVVGLSFAVKQFVGSAEARMVAIGGGVYVLSSAVSEFAPGIIPGLNAYVPGNNRQLRQYIPANQPINGTMGNPGVTVMNSGTATRFRRY